MEVIIKMVYDRELEKTIWVAEKLFDRGKVNGSSANISVKIGDVVYISGSGTSFGNLKKEDFVVMYQTGEIVRGERKPSKEYPLHLLLYQKKRVGAVIHTHSFYATLWSCLHFANPKDVMPDYTPYLKMKVGTVGLIPYAPPGSQELFQLFEDRIMDSDGYLLSNHGPVIGGENIMDAFYGLEELEESAKIAWHLLGVSTESVNLI